VKQWVEALAPAEYRYTILDTPPADLILDDAQKSTLQKISDAFADPALPWEGSAIHEKIHAIKEAIGIAPKKLFEALYQIFLGRTSGPQIGWFLSTMDRNEVLEKLRSALKKA
jgi:lysyl-tRNA synthetase class I